MVKTCFFLLRDLKSEKMGDEVDDLDLGFDASLKKKKKKKKPFDLEAALEGADASTPEAVPSAADDAAADTTAAAETAVSTPKADAEDDDDINLDFGGLKKKKKKKKVMIDLGDEDAAPAETPVAETEPVPDAAVDDDLGGEDFDLDLGLKKKKKKKKPVDVSALENDLNALNLDGEDGEDGNEPDEAEEVSDQISLIAWRADSVRDYTYDELLARVFEIMHQKNPDMVAGEKKKFVMKPPQVVRAGAKKTSFVNFTEICRLLHRQPKHLMAFLMAELGTSGSVDGTNQLVIKGRFQQKQIENVLRRYIKEYVTCHTCRSPETMLQRDTRLYFLQCETCGSRCSVATIKSGFQAMTSKRAAIRAKAQ